jgi:CheY-like chemotaxis protein
MKRILWVDDEIEMLKSHIMFIKDKGYEIESVTNGEDAIELVRSNHYDLIFLDEMMAGLTGLQTLSEIKEINPDIPVVMITKSEEENLMEEAIGSKITDYLIKPVNPSQVLLVIKKILEKKKISSEYLAKDYLQDFREINMVLQSQLTWQDWVSINNKLIYWDLEFDKNGTSELRDTLNNLKRECNKEFSKFIENNYKKWINNLNDENTPILTTEIVNKFVFPLLNEAQTVFFIVIDCLRLDQWLVMQKHLIDYFNIERTDYFTILPTATEYARNSLFSGLFPAEIQKYYPNLWDDDSETDEKSKNKHEKEFLQLLLDRKRIRLRNELKYIKIIDPEYGRNFENNIMSYQNSHLVAVVYNFLDMIVHSRHDSQVIKEIALDEAAFRSLTNSWFTHSSLLSVLKTISKMKNTKVVITTDHGSIRALRGAKIMGDKTATPNLRFKFGKGLKVDAKQGIFLMNPNDYKLPRFGLTTNFIIAKEDYYFVFVTDYHKYLNQYKDTFLHGGISMEEMIVPVIVLTPKD